MNPMINSNSSLRPLIPSSSTPRAQHTGRQSYGSSDQASPGTDSSPLSQHHTQYYAHSTADVSGYTGQNATYGDPRNYQLSAEHSQAPQAGPSQASGYADEPRTELVIKSSNDGRETEKLDKSNHPLSEDRKPLC